MTEEDVCSNAELSYSTTLEEGIELRLNEKLVIDLNITSDPDCPFSCKLDMQYRKFVQSFDRDTGVLELYSKDKFHAGHDFPFKIKCWSETSDAYFVYKNFVYVPELTKPGKRKGHNKSHKDKNEIRRAVCMVNPVEG